MKPLLSKLIVWNVHCMGISHKCLRNLIKRFTVNLIGISEPFLKEVAICRFAQEFDLNNFSTNEVMRGKIWVMWNMNVNFEVVCMSDQWIYGWVQHEGVKVMITFIYAKCFG